ILRPLLAHLLHASPTSSKCDLKTVFIVSIFRALFNDSTPISMLESQSNSILSPEIKGPIWVVRDEFPAPLEQDVKKVLYRAIEGLSDGTDSQNIGDVDILPVSGEWVGHRTGVGKDELEPMVAEAHKYDCLMREVKSRVTILFLHGGQFFQRNPASRRRMTHELAMLTSGRVFAVRYRLSPQNMFPAALLDAIIAYLSLLYPSPNSLHEAVQASDICLSGDSSGANICMALLQTILELQRQSSDSKARVLWHGKEQILPLPAGVATHSAFLDLTRSLPSETANLPFDLLPDPVRAPFPSSSYIPSSIWPASPPRHQVYTSTAMLKHPLVSPIMAKDWRNCTTRWWASFGQECLADSSIVVAQRMTEQGIPVCVEKFGGMPHDFTLIFPDSKSGKRCFEGWAAFIRDATQAAGQMKA
ncbi:hypothetical protein OIDMADRAFT_70755, partial [Oidiodendron maius Zn]